MRYQEHVEYEVLYNGAMERAAVQAQQRTAPPPEPPSRPAGPGRRTQNARDLVGAGLRACYSISASALARKLGLHPATVYHQLDRFVSEGKAERFRAGGDGAPYGHRYRWVE